MRTMIFLCCILMLSVPCFAGSDLLIYSGAGLMKPMEKMRTNFEKRHDISIDVHYAGSGEIFGLLTMGQCCDVFIPGAEKYTMDALKKGYIEEASIHKIVKHIPVIAVPEGNPGDIHNLEDLAKDDIKLAIGDPKACAIGKMGTKILKKNDLYSDVRENIAVRGPTVNQLLIYVATNRVDGTIIWEDLTAWAEGKGKVEVISIDKDKNIIKTVPTAVTTCSKHPKMAHKFNQYISSKEGLSIWKKWGFQELTN